MTDKFAHKAADWDQPAKIKMAEIFVQKMLATVKPEKGWKALEIGAGTGLIGLRLLPLVDSVVFEDTSGAMLNVLRSKLKGGERVEIVFGELFGYIKRDIDFVFSNMAFHHIPDIGMVLDHLGKITNPGATVVIGDLIKEDGSFHKFESIPHNGFHPDEIKSIFDANGFKTESFEIYNKIEREPTPGNFREYQQFILTAKKQ